jgi:membrane-bound serine protease (ClpP class)
MGLVGEVGLAKTVLDPHGKVFVHGELWNAVCRTPVTAGARVRVVNVTGLTLEVEPVEPDEVHA